MKFSKGFTLIELLVVIAIIGVLSSIVLASLNTARARGADATIKSQLAGIRTQAGIVYENMGNNYGTGFSTTGGTSLSCTGAVDNTLFGTTTVSGMIASALASSGAVSCTTDVTSASNASKWVVAARLKTDNTLGWCVDWSGASKQETWSAVVSGSAINTVCP